MILDFASIKHDFYGKIEQPVLTLKTPDGRIISTIPSYFDLNCTFRFNDISEVTFTVPAYPDGDYQDIYDKITGMERVNIEPFGDFILINPATKNEGGTKETKECKAYSLEYALNHKRAEIPAGTYNFYNPADNSDCITQMITEFAPDWSIGSIDRELIGCWRTFDTVDDNLYSFMMNTLQESFNCLFLFDTFNKKINVISANNTVSNLPIYLSYNNLLKSVEIEELTDEIVTALSGYGSGDDVNIRSVNPNGTNTIYNIDYFIGKGDLPEDLTAKWQTYKENYELYRKVFSNLNVLYSQKISERTLAEAKRSVLGSEYDAINTAYLTAQTQHGENSEYDEEIAKLKEDLDKKQSECEAQDEKVKQLKSEEEEISNQIDAIIDVCKLDKYFSSDEMKILTQYFKQDSIAEDTFTIPEYSSAVLESNSNVLTLDSKATVKIVGSEIYASNIAEVFKPDENGEYSSTVKDETSGEDMLNLNGDLEAINGATLPEDVAETVAKQLNDEAKRKVYEFRGGSFEFKKAITEIVNGNETPKDVILTGDVVNVDFHYNVQNLDSYVDETSDDITKTGYFTLTATLRNASYDGTPYPNMNVSISGKILRDTPFMGDHFVAFDIETAVFYCTASTTEYQKQAVIQELYDYIKDSLDKLAQPSYEFDVESGNFVFAQDFEPFKNELKLGSTVNLALDDGEEYIIKPILIEIQLNYDDESDFSLTFSNKYRSSRSEFKLADLIQDMSHTSHSVSLNKASYSAYKDSKAGNQVENLTKNELDVAKNKIINSSNQGMEWNSSGMFLRQLMPDGNYSPEQVGLINNLIAMTDDSWESVKLAIGHFKDKNIGDTWGIVAPNITGTLLAGENLVIENTVMDESGLKTVKQFKVDGSGAWLNNASFILSQEPNETTGYPGGRILIDPKYGIAAGDMQLFTQNGHEITPSFLDEDGNIVYDESEKIETPEGSVYYVPAHTKFLFDIRTGNAYFGGDINGKNIIAQTINGNAIADYTLDASTKLTGDANADLIYKNVIAAINKYIQFKTDSGEPVVKMGNAVIGDLTADNFKGGRIEANSITTEALSANVIEAINASFGKIDADRVNIKTLDADRIIIEGDNGKLLIDPTYGIAVGNNQLFTTSEADGEFIISPSFVDESGNLVIDSTTKAPVNSSFFFDINTGKSYFAGEISANQITSGKLSSDFLEIKDGYITNAMIENLSASKIQGGQISADIMSTNVIAAINANIGEATIESAKIGDLSANYMTTKEFVADHVVSGTGQFTKWLTGVNISGDIINAGTISTERLLIFDPDSNKSIIWALNDGVLESQEGLSEEELKRLTLNGKLITAESITADKIAANAVTAEKIAAGSVSADKIESGAITADKIAAGAITGDKIEAGSLTIGALDPSVKKALDDAESNAASAKETVKGTVKSVINEYSLSSSETEYIAYPVGYIWNTTPPTHIDGKYMWTRVKTTYVDTSISPTYSDPVCISGAKGNKGDKGDDGHTPVKGVDYFDGSKGEDGSSSYIHIRYSKTSDGSDMVTSPTSETKYIGVAITTSQTSPTDAGSYEWSKYVGENGIPGDKGADGKTSYLHIAYANSADGTDGFSTSDSTDKLYIGQYSDFSQNDSTTPSDYQWTKIKGDKGQDGVDGNDGISPTVTLSKTGDVTTITITDASGTHKQTIKDGTNGTPGAPGSDGRTVYFHVKYSNDGGKTFTSNSGETVGSYLGTCTDYEESDPTTVESYTWVKIKGEQGIQGDKGEDGRGILSQEIAYQTSSSGAEIPTGAWNSNIPDVPLGQYLWTRTTTTYTKGTPENVISYSVSRVGADGVNGSDGNDGRGISSTEITYQVGSSQTDVPTGTWSETIPETSIETPYLWTRTITNYTTGDPSVAYSISSTFDSIEVGGRNYFSSKTETPFDNNNEYALVSTTSTGYYIGEFRNLKRPLRELVGQTVVISCDCMNSNEDAEIIVQCYIKNGETYHFLLKFPGGADEELAAVGSVATSWNRLAFKAIVLDNPDTPDEIPTLAFGSNVAGTKIRNVKFEIGNKATDWTPAPEDVKTDINDVQENVDKTKNDLSDTREILDAAKSDINNIDKTLNGEDGKSGLIADNAQIKTDIKNNTDAISNTQKDVDSVTNNFDKFKTDYEAVFRTEKGGLRINGVQRNDDGTIEVLNVSTLFAPNRWSFYSGYGDDAVEVAYISNQKLYIETAEITNKIIIGKHSLMSDGDDFTLVYEG